MTVFVHKHALLLYFSGAFLIAWVFWFLEPSLRDRDGFVADLFIKFGTYGPVLAAMLVSALSNPERVPSPLRLRLLAGGLALAIAIYINWPTAAWLLSTHAMPSHWILLAIIALLPAWVFFNAHSGLRGVQDLLCSLTRWRTHPLWFLAALFLMLIIGLVGVPLTALLTGQTLGDLFSGIRSSETLNHFGMTFLATALYGGPLGEEAGWRGFALPRLQKRFDPLLASVILGAFWGLWHLPLHLNRLLQSGLREPAQRDPPANVQYHPADTCLHLAVQPLQGKPAGNGPPAHREQRDIKHRCTCRGVIYYNHRRGGNDDRLRPDV